MKQSVILCIFPILFTGKASVHDSENFQIFAKQFVTGYRALHLPDLDLSYVENLRNIKSADLIAEELAFFSSVKTKLPGFNRSELDSLQRDDYDLMNYETSLNLKRLALEKQWVAEKHDSISTDGIYHIHNGKEWYAYFLERWVAASVTPEEVYTMGLKEIERVKQKIQNIRLQTGMSEQEFYQHLGEDSFFLNSSSRVKQAFETTKKIAYSNLHSVFNVQHVPELKIAQGRNEALVQTPGYYSDDTFYYNYFDKPYNKRQIDWLFIHEAVPGHHYQSSVARQLPQSDVHQLFYYLGFSEGWAAYTEELGKDIGLYGTPYDELGKWEWDIVRSVRVPLDVGLNYYGWTDEQALAFWKKNITGQDDIALREIKRMRRWPAQVVTYKYGALQIMQWKAVLSKEQKERFDIKAFHDRILNSGSLPWFMIRKNVMGTHESKF